MIYLKTHFYTENEINFININLQECYDKVDKFIVCEFNITHTGEERDFIFNNFEHLINPLYKDKLLYVRCDVSDLAIKVGSNENLAHNTNELLMRSYFVKMVDFNDDDIIISVDCDEIIYKESYHDIINGVIKHQCVSIELNQFFYKLSYHWVDNKFVAPTAAYYKYYKYKYPSHWRYDGVLLSGKKGVHFSWCMSIDDMIYKLNSYAHIKYKEFANKDILDGAVKNKIYPFDLKKPFHINVVERESDILPKSILDSYYDEFWKIMS